jgi:uncharacterized RDD family membrane protein YckC
MVLDFGSTQAPDSANRHLHRTPVEIDSDDRRSGEIMDTALDNTDTFGGAENGKWLGLATPWARYWARFLDIQINNLALALLVRNFFPVLVSKPIFYGTGGSYILGLLLLPASLILDAACQAIVGTTIGKAITGIRVETIDHRKLSIDVAMRRNLSVYLRGLILGLPLISFAGCLLAYNHIQKYRITTWDAALFTRAYNVGGNIARTTIAAIIMISIQLGISTYAAYEKSGAYVTTDDEMEAAIPVINAGLPRQIDDGTRFDSAQYSRPYRLMVFTYTLTGRNDNLTPTDAFARFSEKAAAEIRLRKIYCEDPSVKLYRNNGIAVKYLYLANDQSTVAEHIFHVSDCR